MCVARQTRRHGKSPGNPQGALPPSIEEGSARSGYSQLGRAQEPETPRLKLRPRGGLALAQISRDSQQERDGGGGGSTKNTAEILWLLAPRREEPNPLNTLRGFRVGKELTSQVEARTLKALTSKAHQSRSAGTEPDPQKARIPRKRSGVWGEPPGAFPELLLARLLQPIAPRAPKRGGERAICERGRAKGEQHFCKRSPR